MALCSIDNVKGVLLHSHVHVCIMTTIMCSALVAQSVEHHHGKVGVSGSNPLEGSFFINGGESPFS